MKAVRRYIYIGIILFSVILVSCSESLMSDINTNPNTPTDANASLMLPQVIVESSYGTTGTDLAWYASVFCEHSAGVFAQLQDADTRLGVTNSSLFNNSWSNVYLNMFRLKTIISKCSKGGGEEGNTAALGIAEVLLAYNLGIVVDLWGDVPYSDAFRGQANFRPSYDRAQDLYPVVQALLDSAIKALAQKSSVTISNQDLIYGGDLKRWTKAAYSLKIRYLNRLSNLVNRADEIIALLPRAFTSSSDALVYDKFQEATNGANPWFSFRDTRNYLAVGKTLYDLMVGINDQDPRFDAYFGGGYGSVSPAPNGAAVADQKGLLYSRSSLAIPTAPIPLMSYHELKFIESEAYLHKGDRIKAYAAFNKAVVAAFDYCGASVGNYLLSLPNSANLSLSDIYIQKYIAMYESASIEAYNELRRTGIPAMNNPNNRVPSLGFVHRLPYVSDEIATNSEHIPSISTFEKLFWAK